MSHIWTEEMDIFLKENYPSLNTSKVLELMQEKFYSDLTHSAIMNRVHFLKIKKNKVWTEEIDNFLKENYTQIGFRKSQVLIKELYNKDIPYATIRDHAHDIGILSPRSCGNDRRVWTKEMDNFMIENYPKYGAIKFLPIINEEFNCNLTHDAIAQRASYLKIKSDKVGIEVIWGGKRYIKISNKKRDPNRKTNTENYKAKHHMIWEEHYGPIPKGYMVLFVDRNFENFDISNLRCVPKKYMSLLSHSKWMTGDPEILDAGIAWCQLYFALKEIKERRQR